MSLKINLLSYFCCLFFIFYSADSIDFVNIVGGNETDIKNYPYQLEISVLGSGIHVCGASLISRKYALCAAHCIIWFPGGLHSLVEIRAGSSNRTQGGQLVKISQIYKHPKFDSSTYDYDVSILELQEEVTVENSATINLAEPNTDVTPGDLAIASGWGVLHEGEVIQPEVLHAVEIPIVDQNTCNETLSGRVTPRMICAGVLGVGGKDTCIGDSGGPLVINNTQVGIVSWGEGCGRPDFAKTFTAVGNVEIREFIRNITGI